MKINIISAQRGFLKQNTEMKTDRPGFRGLEKGAQKAGQAAAEAAGKAFSQGTSAAGKAGAEKTSSTKFLHTAFEAVKFISKKVLDGISKIIGKISEIIKAGGKGAKKAQTPAQGAKAAKPKTPVAQENIKPAQAAETIAPVTEELAQEAAEAESKVIPFPKGMEIVVAGKKFIYTPGKDKLPEGAEIQDGVLMLDKSIKNDPKMAIQKMREAIELAKGWGKEEPTL